MVIERPHRRCALPYLFPHGTARCLGHEFALADQRDPCDSDRLEWRIRQYKPHEQEYGKAKEELLAFRRQRYERINARLEMGWPVEDVDKLQEDYCKVILEEE